jgi:hypothetical protein
LVMPCAVSFLKDSSHSPAILARIYLNFRHSHH